MKNKLQAKIFLLVILDQEKGCENFVFLKIFKRVLKGRE
jgi:hypothetical protein